MDPQFQAFQHWLNRHLVSFVLIYSHLDDKGNAKGDRVAACSGFIMTFGDAWFLVTAGHVLEKLDKLIAHPQVQIHKSFLIDDLGAQAKYKGEIPFTYETEKRLFEHDYGLDYGLVALSPNERRLLEANGVVPVGIENWIDQNIDQCQGFVLTGIPEDWVEHERRGGNHEISIGTIFAIVKRLKEPPPGSEATDYERFIGDIGQRVDLPNGLQGTSGGPIIGFYVDAEGKHRYWIVALQSSCLENRYIFGCPVKLFGQLLLDMMREWDEPTEAK